MTLSKITVVIPTRERPDTLAKCLQTVVNQDYGNLEIVVSDNFSGPETVAVVEALNDPRVRYFNTGRRVSMSHNFEFAISKIDEGWIVVLGDDDGLLPNSLGRVVKLLEKSGLEALSSSTCSYNWPSRNVPHEAILTVPMKRGEKVVDAARMMKRLMDWNFGSLVLPQLYTGGIVSAALFKRIRNVKGSFFQSQIPDIYSSLAICSVIDKYVFTREPFAINGGSKHSNGAALFKLAQTPFLSEGNIPFHPDIPLPTSGTFTFSLPALVCESYLQSQYLRHDVASVTPAAQLELILSQTTVGHDLLYEWSKTFAAHHGLDHDRILAASRRTPVRRRLSLASARFANLGERYRLDASHGLAINDVFEASLAAATILSTRPNRGGNFLRTIRRVAGRKLRQRRALGTSLAG